jgi:hypothetical protein
LITIPPPLLPVGPDTKSRKAVELSSMFLSVDFRLPESKFPISKLRLPFFGIPEIEAACPRANHRAPRWPTDELNRTSGSHWNQGRLKSSARRRERGLEMGDLESGADFLVAKLESIRPGPWMNLAGVHCPVRSRAVSNAEPSRIRL